MSDIETPVLRNDGETLKKRMTSNAYDNILPSRYLSKGEVQEDLFDRVAGNLAVPEAIYSDDEVTITSEEIKPEHPSRIELFEDIWHDVSFKNTENGIKVLNYGGDYVDVSNLSEKKLTERNAKWVAFEPLLERCQEQGWDDTVESLNNFYHELKDMMERLQFTPNSPTLMNAGDELQQLSACFVISPEDDMGEIHQTVKEASEVFQSGGGMGYGFWTLRPRGTEVGSTDGIASGPISFMRTYDQMCGTVAQGGARRGAQMGVMKVDHPDVIEFIHAKRKDVSLAHTLRLNDPDDYTHNSFTEALEEARELIDDEGRVPEHLRNAVEGHLSNFNISVGVTDDFMEAVENDEEFTMKDPTTDEPFIANAETKKVYSWFGLDDYVEVGKELTIPAQEIWERMVKGAHENGEPGVVFIDRFNKKHSFPVDTDEPLQEQKHAQLATNPCGEQPLQEYEACNLGHINLSTVVSEDAYAYDGSDIEEFMHDVIDMEELNRRIELGTRFLDNVVTMSAFPVDEIEETVRKNRKIGLGIMGLAQMFIEIGLEYGSEDANDFARKIMKHINHESKYVSHELAEERGSFDVWGESKYADPIEYSDWFEQHVGLPAENYPDGYPIRNHNTTTIAPTGTTSMVADTSGGCEPIYNLAYYKNVSDDVQGDEMLVEFDSLFIKALEENNVDVQPVKEEAEELMENNEYEKEKLTTVPDEIVDLFVTTGDLTAKEHGKVQCALQEGVDSAISKTVNAPADATPEDTAEAFMRIYKDGGKGVTYYRDGTRSKQVLTTRADNQELDDDEFVDNVVEKIDEDEELLKQIMQESERFDLE